MIEHVGIPEAVAADAAYKTPAITNYLIENEITPALPYTRPRTNEYSQMGKKSMACVGQH